MGNTFPTYAVWGNHDIVYKTSENYIIDRTQELRNLFTQAGILILENESIIFEKKGNLPITLIGLDELWAHRINTDKAYEDISSDNPIITITHNPDSIKIITKEKRKNNLMVAGHTHGGQIRLPFIGPIVPLPTTLGRNYDKGLKSYENNNLFITSGIGEMGTRARLFNPPQIDIINLYY
jgi:predicted MPP superfamily phosphohydrolase